MKIYMGRFINEIRLLCRLSNVSFDKIILKFKIDVKEISELCMLGNFTCFLSSAFFSKLNFTKISGIPSVSNSWDQNQIAAFCQRTDLGSNCLHRLSTDNFYGHSRYRAIRNDKYSIHIFWNSRKQPLSLQNYYIKLRPPA